MGGPYFVAFLNRQTQVWKDKYIHSFISIDGAFGGGLGAALSLISSKCMIPILVNNDWFKEDSFAQLFPLRFKTLTRAGPP